MRRRVRPTDRKRCPATYSITLRCGWQCCLAGAQRRWARLGRYPRSVRNWRSSLWAVGLEESFTGLWDLGSVTTPAVARIDHFLINRASPSIETDLAWCDGKPSCRQAPGDCLQVGRLCPGSTSIRFVEEATQEFASLVPIDARVGVPALDPQLIVQRLADDLEDGLLR